MTTKRKAAEVNTLGLKRHLTEWLRDPASFVITVEAIADLTGKEKRNVKRDIKRMREVRRQPVGPCEVLNGSDFLTLLAGYTSHVSFVVVELLAELYADTKEALRLWQH